MAKKWIPMPEHILAALNERIAKQYQELIASLPRIGIPNPSIDHEVTAEGFAATVKFYPDKGREFTSLWKYTHNNQRWNMDHDWSD